MELFAPQRKPVPISSLSIRSYDQDRDSSWLHELWHRALASKWSLSQDELSGRLRSATVSFVVEDNSTGVAFCAVRHRQAGTAALLVLLVHPDKQRQGIGSALLHAAESTLKKQGVTHLDLGFAGEGDFFWQGIPVGSKAWPFFAWHGWNDNERSSDLVLGLDDYKAPGWVVERSIQAKVCIHAASLCQYEAVRNFERTHFPLWVPFFEGFEGYRAGNILIAEDACGTIVGSVLLSSVASVPWKLSLGERCGSLGVLGVAKQVEGRGVGLALAARGAELLQERGCTACHIGWTGLVAWYGKLGAEPWAEYHMSSKSLAGKITYNGHSADIREQHIGC